MDTFNFSFSGEESQEGKPDAEETETSSSSSAASENEAPTNADDDPFGFDAFDLSQINTPAEAGTPDLTAGTSEAESAPAPDTDSDSASGGDFDFSSLSEGFSLDEPQSGNGFPSLSLEPEAAPAPTESDAADLGDFGLGGEADDPLAFSDSDLNLTPDASAETGASTDASLQALDTDLENTDAGLQSLNGAFGDFGTEPQESDALVAEANDDLAPELDTPEPLAPTSFSLSDADPLAPTETATEPVAAAATETPEVEETPEVADEPSQTQVDPAALLATGAAVGAAGAATAAATTSTPEAEPAEKVPEAPWPKPTTAPVSTPTPESAPAAETPREPKARAKQSRFLTTDDPYGEVAPPRERLRVAILGASGIGKNHARWFARHSCDIVSFLGSTDESVEVTSSQLQSRMGFEVKGYSDLGQLLSETQPQAVCIASPSHLHYAQAIQCLEAGIHVLCEKPLVYTPTLSKRENLDGARELLKVAAQRDLVLGTQLQYGTATPILCRLAGVSPFEVGDFAMEIETTNPKSPRDPRELWIDLAAHPLSVSQYLAGDGGEIIPETLQIMPSRAAYTTEVTARFGVRNPEGRVVMCRVIVRWFDKIVDNREPRRRFSFNGRIVQYSGVRSPDGTYIAQYVAPDGYISHYSDPVDYLIGNFVRTCWQEDELVLSSEQGVQNLDWLLSTAEKL